MCGILIDQNAVAIASNCRRTRDTAIRLAQSVRNILTTTDDRYISRCNTESSGDIMRVKSLG